MELLKQNTATPNSMTYDVCEIILHLQKKIEEVNEIYDDLWDVRTRYNRFIERLEKYDDDDWNAELQSEYDRAYNEVDELNKQMDEWESWLKISEETHKLLMKAKSGLEDLELDSDY